MIEPLAAGQALPQVDPSALPRDVRKGSDEDKRLYRAALGFERQLLGQLLESMTQAAEVGGDEEDGGDAAGGAYKSLLPATLADSLVQKGGTGIAHDLYRSMREGSSK